MIYRNLKYWKISGNRLKVVDRFGELAIYTLEDLSPETIEKWLNFADNWTARMHY